MTKTHSSTADPRKQGEVHPLSPLLLRLESLSRKVGSRRLSRWADRIISVAEPAGRTFMSTVAGGEGEHECKALTVISGNLWHDWPRFRDIEKRLESFARLVERENGDVLLLQEIARTGTFKADEWLADRLNMSYVYSRANGSEKIGFEEGLGVFSRFRMQKFPYIRQVSRLTNPFVRRLALGVEVNTPCGEVLAFSVHLGLLRDQNATQLNDLRQWIHRLAEGRSAIIGGDFNAPDRSRQIRKVRSFWNDTYWDAQTRGQSETHSLKWPWGERLISHRLDYIFLQHGEPAWKVREVHHLEAPEIPHSDHLAVVARLEPIHP